MAFKLRCRFCGGEHKADSKHFPKAMYENRLVDDPKDKLPFNKDGSPRPRRQIMTQILVGHICRKCVSKAEKVSFIRQHNIRVDKSGRRSLMQQIQDKIKEIQSKGVKVK